MSTTGQDPRRGAGSAAAETAGKAAQIVASVARESGGAWSGAAGAAAQASTLAERLATLADVDAEVFTAALDALAKGSADLRPRLEEAAAAPLEIAEAAADVAEAALHVAERCDGLLRTDAAGAAALAAGAALAAAQLVRANLALAPDDDRVRRAFKAADDARYSASRALDAGP
ncbi:MAG: cyclodeaminase/cyclohydrolase family protein [Verrucomicrobiota bacterium]